jgi:hypothetical protein
MDIFPEPTQPTVTLSSDSRPTPGGIRLGSRALVAGGLALSAAIFAQYYLRGERTQVATIVYLISAVVFAISLRRASPTTLEFPVEPPTADTGHKTITPPVPNLKTFRLPVFKRPEPKPTAPRAGFFSNWRYYTLADILKGRQPNLPTPPAVETPPESTVEISAVSAEAGIESQATTTEPVAVAVPLPAEAPMVIATSDSVPAIVTTWSGFERPQNLLVSADGALFVVDTARHTLCRLDSKGHIVKQWALPNLPAPQTQNYALSQDGQRLYAADADHGLIYVFELRSDGATT